MARYTLNSLKNDLHTINGLAAEMGADTYLRASSRNGYTGLDEFSLTDNRCLRNIECGSPKDCLLAAREWRASTPVSEYPIGYMQGRGAA